MFILRHLEDSQQVQKDRKQDHRTRTSLTTGYDLVSGVCVCGEPVCQGPFDCNLFNYFRLIHVLHGAEGLSLAAQPTKTASDRA